MSLRLKANGKMGRKINHKNSERTINMNNFILKLIYLKN